MAGQPGIPNNFNVQTANQQILVSWDQTVGATSYVIQRSLDNITFVTVTTISGSPLATTYVDTSVLLGVQYFYAIQAVNTNGSSALTASLGAVPTTTGEMTLGQIRLAAQQRADRVDSKFVTDSEWNNYINQASFELYDLLVTVYEDYFLAQPIVFVSNGTTYMFNLPDGVQSYTNGTTNAPFVPPPYYKLLGVDLSLNNPSNSFVSVNKFNFSDRNRFVYPNTASTIYGVFNLQYRVMGNQIMFIPMPAAGQILRMWYIPRLKQLLLDTDTTQMGISGWIEYVIVRAAKYALDKEESDTQRLTEELVFLKQRIEESAANRDAGMPDKISNTNQGNWSNGWSGGSGGAIGGF